MLGNLRALPDENIFALANDLNGIVGNKPMSSLYKIESNFTFSDPAFPEKEQANTVNVN
jgi:hypothetical protein